MDGTELCFTPAVALAAAIRARTLSPVEIVDAVLARIEAVNPKLNAFLAVDADGARAAARRAEAAVMRGDPLGPLHGLPVPIKDLEPAAGLRCTYGSRFYADHVAPADGIVLERVKAAGGIDLLLTPQMPAGAWPIEGPAVEIGGTATPGMFDRLPFTYPFNLTGQPAASVPCGFTASGLPVALQIVGRWHADTLVLQAAAALEHALPWAHARPAL